MQWWYWVVGGLVIAMMELLVPSFFLIWFGLAAVLVGVLMMALPMPLSVQLVLWASLSAALTVAWFRYFKSPDRTKAGLAKEAVVGEVGLVIRAVSEMQRGEIMFQRPILGAEKWPILCDESIAAGEKARVVDVIGQLIKVEPIHKG